MNVVKYALGLISGINILLVYDGTLRIYVTTVGLTMEQSLLQREGILTNMLLGKEQELETAFDKELVTAFECFETKVDADVLANSLMVCMEKLGLKFHRLGQLPSPKDIMGILHGTAPNTTFYALPAWMRNHLRNDFGAVENFRQLVEEKE